MTRMRTVQAPQAAIRALSARPPVQAVLPKFVVSLDAFDLSVGQTPPTLLAGGRSEVGGREFWMLVWCDSRILSASVAFSYYFKGPRAISKNATTHCKLTIFFFKNVFFLKNVFGKKTKLVSRFNHV